MLKTIIDGEQMDYLSWRGEACQTLLLTGSSLSGAQQSSLIT